MKRWAQAERYVPTSRPLLPSAKLAVRVRMNVCNYTNHYHKTLPSHYSHTHRVFLAKSLDYIPKLSLPSCFQRLVYVFASRKVSVDGVWSEGTEQMRPSTLLWCWSNSTQMRAYTVCAFKNRPGLCNIKKKTEWGQNVQDRQGYWKWIIPQKQKCLKRLQVPKYQQGAVWWKSLVMYRHNHISVWASSFFKRFPT